MTAKKKAAGSTAPDDPTKTPVIRDRRGRPAVTTERGTKVPPAPTAREVLVDRAVHMAKTELAVGLPLQDFHGQRLVDTNSVRAAYEALAAGERGVQIIDALEQQGLEVTPKVGA